MLGNPVCIFVEADSSVTARDTGNSHLELGPSFLSAQVSLRFPCHNNTRHTWKHVATSFWLPLTKPSWNRDAVMGRESAWLRCGGDPPQEQTARGGGGVPQVEQSWCGVVTSGKLQVHTWLNAT